MTYLTAGSSVNDSAGAPPSESDHSRLVILIPGEVSGTSVTSSGAAPVQRGSPPSSAGAGQFSKVTCADTLAQPDRSEGGCQAPRSEAVPGSCTTVELPHPASASTTPAGANQPGTRFLMEPLSPARRRWSRAEVNLRAVRREKRRWGRSDPRGAARPTRPAGPAPAAPPAPPARRAAGRPMASNPTETASNPSASAAPGSSPKAAR